MEAKTLGKGQAMTAIALYRASVKPAAMRTARKAATVALFLISCPALAQTTNCVPNGPFVNCYNPDGSYSTCNSVGGTWNCQTYGGSRRSSGAEASSQGGGAVGGFMGMLRSMNTRRVEARVAKALRGGDCPSAVDEAFKGDDVNFALNLQAYCARQGH